MQLGKNFKISSDALNVTLFELHTNKKTGAESWKPIKYYANLKEALDGFVDLQINQSGLRTLQEFNEQIAELKKLYRELAVQLNHSNVQPD